ncbi:hypothetical protein LPC08_22380 [Roseomonas sp. OT10]|uniref:hypothetical protein n=1 Tax=Roseomonas cutis TaxID=2897332 RepID=UPI001E295E36|nr:hypothetical protein [Roseomonas sp. OT10]UFN48723.1 hypothetical protein LPC08_22380 [Roseomonas sp. OT10]
MSGQGQAIPTGPEAYRAAPATPCAPAVPEMWDVDEPDEPPVQLALAAAILLVMVLLSPLF